MDLRKYFPKSSGVGLPADNKVFMSNAHPEHTSRCGGKRGVSEGGAEDGNGRKFAKLQCSSNALDAPRSRSPESTPDSTCSEVLFACTTANKNQAPACNYTFPIGGNCTYNVITSNGSDDGYIAWFASFSAGINDRQKLPGHFKAIVGLDCEWCPPWYRESGEAERVSTIQLYCPYADALVFSTGTLSVLPQEVVALLEDPCIAKVGVNIGGDGARLARDFGCHVNSLVNVASGYSGSKSMQDLCKTFCPPAFHIDKNSIENGVRMGNWASWPLSELQIKYAAMDACLSFAIFLFQNKGTWDARTMCSVIMSYCKGMESVDPAKHLPVVSTEDDKTAMINMEKNKNFFLMRRNKSVLPPNLGSGKEKPYGPSDCLSDVCVVISGVLDSMSRDEMTKYIQSHGGKVTKGISKAVTHLLNDVKGTVGPAKLEKCRVQSVPVIGEDVIFNLVRSRST